MPPSQPTNELRSLLNRLGWTQARLARELGVWPMTVSAWATGQSPVPRYVLAYLQLAERVRAVADALR